ncbi:MAG: dihydroorotate dehydrogenase [Desulfobacterales bacterium]|jgi:dihydroorotate dehydrogenase (NAD+) catalytic subunit
MVNMKPDLSITICGIDMANPIVTCSGTSGNGREFARFLDLDLLGAFTAKSITLDKRPGNPTPRIAECTGGILNSIGIQSKGVRHFVREDLPFLRDFSVPVIVSISATRLDEYAQLAEILDRENGIAALEVNISCPNLEAGGSSFGADPELSGRIINQVKEKTKLPVIAKLTPNVTDISVIARSVEANGADALSLINTVAGMAIDVHTRIPRLGNVIGGLSGPAIKPIAIKKVWDTFRSVSIPIIGMGGIVSWQDVIEFILAGSSAVGVGTGLFRNPLVVNDILEGLTAFMNENGIERLDSLRGQVVLPS